VPLDSPECLHPEASTLLMPGAPNQGMAAIATSSVLDSDLLLILPTCHVPNYNSYKTIT